MSGLAGMIVGSGTLLVLRDHRDVPRDAAESLRRSKTPALFTSTSRVLKNFLVSSNSRRTPSVLATSPFTAMVWQGASREISPAVLPVIPQAPTRKRAS